MAMSNAAETRSQKSRTANAPDAISLLKADHREVKSWFREFQRTTSGARKQKLANQICLSLTVHTKIEEEIFYAACREAGVEVDTMDEADVEHAAAKKLISEIKAGKAGDDHWNAKVHVLGEMIRHHIKEEESLGGLFSQAKRAGLDMEELGEKLQKRKTALIKQAKAKARN